MSDSQRRLVRLSIVLALPVVFVLAAAAVVAGLKAAHHDERWTDATKGCPQLPFETAVVLLVDRAAAGGVPAGGLDVQTCRYPGKGPIALDVTVRLHRGDVWRGSHGRALRAFGDDPPAGFHPIGPQGDGGHFGDVGADGLLLVSVVDNAEVRVHHQVPRLAYLSKDVTLFRTPLQAVADRMITQLG